MSKPKKYDSYYTSEPPVMCTQPGFEHRQLCQGCVEEGHVQLDSSDVFDCKMVFKSGHGQCCCYSKEHSYRRCQKCRAELTFKDGWNANKQAYDGPLCRKCRGE